MSDFYKKFIRMCFEKLQSVFGCSDKKRQAFIFVLLSLAVVLFVITTNHVYGQNFATNMFLDGLKSFILWFLTLVLSLLVKLLLTVVELLITVLSYNSFTEELPVIQGWIYVRNISNMFFSLMILLIVYGTIFGKGSDYKQALPKLLLMAILINFSKTITGFAIDLSQVPTLTFLEGFKASAVYNFQTGLGLDSFGKISEEVAGNNPSTMTFGNILVGVLLGIFIASVALYIITLLVIMSLLRIIALWILIVLAPLAFAGKGLDLIKSYTWDKWVDQLKKWLIFAPVMTFFLYLSMIMMSNPDSATQNFEVGSENIFTGDIGNPAYIARVAICLGMLFGSLYAGQQLAGSAMGMAKGASKNIAGRAFKASKVAAAVGIGGAIGATALFGSRATSALGTGLKKLGLEKIGRGVGKTARGLSSVGGAGFSMMTKKGRSELKGTVKTYAGGKWNNFLQERQRKFDIATQGSSHLKQLGADEKMTFHNLQRKKYEKQGFQTVDLLRNDKVKRELQEKQENGTISRFERSLLNSSTGKILNEIDGKGVDNLIRSDKNISSGLEAYEKKYGAFERDKEGNIKKNARFEEALREVTRDAYKKNPKLYTSDRQGQVEYAINEAMNDPLVQTFKIPLKITDDQKEKAVNAALNLRNTTEKYVPGGSKALENKKGLSGVGESINYDGGTASQRATQMMKDVYESEDADEYTKKTLRGNKNLDENILGNLDISKKTEVLHFIQGLRDQGKDETEIKKDIEKKYGNAPGTTGYKLNDNYNVVEGFLNKNRILNGDEHKEFKGQIKDVKDSYYDKKTVDSMNYVSRVQKEEGTKGDLDHELTIMRKRLINAQNNLQNLQMKGFGEDTTAFKDMEEIINTINSRISQINKQNVRGAHTRKSLSVLNNESISNSNIYDKQGNMDGSFGLGSVGSHQVYFDSNIGLESGKIITSKEKEKVMNYYYDKLKNLKTLERDIQSASTNDDKETVIELAIKELGIQINGDTTDKQFNDLKTKILSEINSVTQQSKIADTAFEKATQKGDTVLRVGDASNAPTATKNIVSVSLNNITREINQKLNATELSNYNKIDESTLTSQGVDFNVFIEKLKTETNDAFRGMGNDEIVKYITALKSSKIDLSNIRNTASFKLLEKTIDNAIQASATSSNVPVNFPQI